MHSFNVDRIENSVFIYNTYILSAIDEEQCWLIDCGDPDPILRLKTQNNKSICGILITHTHFDHIYGLNVVIDNFPYCNIYTSSKVEEGLYSEKLNLSVYQDRNFYLYSGNVSILNEGDSIVLWKYVSTTVFETPGHDWSSLCYNIGNYWFTGDSYIPYQKIIACFPRSIKKQAYLSVQKLFNLFCDVTAILPMHDKSIKMEQNF